MKCAGPAAFAVVLALAIAMASTAQAQTGNASGEIALWRVGAVTGLGVVLAIAAALVLAAARRRGGPLAFAPFPWKSRPGRVRRVRVIDQAAATPTLTFCLLACDDREYLVAATPQALTVLDRGPAPDPEA